MVVTALPEFLRKLQKNSYKFNCFEIKIGLEFSSPIFLGMVFAQNFLIQKFKTMGFLQNLRKTIQLLQHVDFQQIAELNQKIDLASAMNALSKLNDQQLNSLLKMMNSVQKKKEQRKSIPLSLVVPSPDLVLLFNKTNVF